MKPILLLIQGNKVTRYVAGKKDQEAELDWNSSNLQIKRDLEYFRRRGLDFEKENDND